MRFSIRVSAVAALVTLVALAQTASAQSPVTVPIGTPTLGNLGLQLPWAVTGGAKVTGPSRAKLTGTVDANGLTTDSYFEYGEDEALDLKTAQDSVGAGLDAAKVVTDIVGLQPGMDYSYRIVAESLTGTSTGATHTFTTPTASSSQAGTPSKRAARKARCRVPRVRGKTVKAAKRAIRRSHCKVGKISRKRSKSAKRGRVVSQSPKAGTRRAKGAKVRMTVKR